MLISQSNETPVGVVGSGTMAAGVAEVVARSGRRVVLMARSTASAEGAMTRLVERFDREVSRDRLSASDRDHLVGLVTVTDSLDAAVDCGLVVESVVEDLGVKKELFSQLDQIVKPETILASNTSTLPIVDLAIATQRPENVCGIHFFNPAPSMNLVEIVRPLTASEATISAALHFAEACGKQAVLVEDRAGFVVNALLFPYLNSAVRLWERGTASIVSIDAAMQGGCNFPMGPFALLDLVGLDVAVAILDALYEEFREPSQAASPVLRRKVSAGQLGRKSGQGFFTY